MKNLPKVLRSFLLPILALSALLTVNACGPLPKDSNSAVSATEKAVSLDPLKSSLASGYDSSRDIRLLPCIEPDEFVYAGTQYSNLSYLRDFTYDELADEMGIGVSGKANLFGLLKGEVSGNVAKTMAKTNETSSFIYKFDVVGKNAILKSPKLSAKGQSAFQLNDPLQFRQVCGDQYIEQVKLGAQLFIGVRYTFTSSADKETLQIKLKGSALWGLIKFTKNWTKEQKKILKDVRINIEAFQIGGDPRKLEALKKSLNKTSCAGDDIEACAAGLDQLLDYAQTGFSKQLNGMKVTNVPFSGPAILGVETVPYNAQMIYQPQSKTFVTIDIKRDATPRSTFFEALARRDRLQADLGIAMSRNQALLAFNLSALERSTIQVTIRELESLMTRSDALMADTCTPAKKRSDLIASCIAKIGAVEVSGHKALLTIELSSR